MSKYTYSEGQIGGHVEQGKTADISEALLNKMRAKLEKDGAVGWRPIAVNLTGGRTKSADLHGNTFTGQGIGWSVLRRHDPDHWEVATAINLGTTIEITNREGVDIDGRESDGWQVVGYMRRKHSASPEEATMETALFESVTVYTRPAR